MEGVRQKEWDEFVSRREHAQFLQSYSWGAFQKSIGRTVEYRVSCDAEKITSAGFLITLPAYGARTYQYSPRGPLGFSIDAFLDQVQHTIENERIIFLRIEPEYESSVGHSFRSQLKRTLPVQPADEWHIDLKKEENEIFGNMHQKTRYNIRLASKKNVQIIACSKGEGGFEKAIDDFLLLIKETSRNKGFRLHEEQYYRNLITFFSQDKLSQSKSGDMPYIRLYQAIHQGSVLASCIVIFFGDMATYLHGGTSTLYREVMAPHILHWTIMRDARAQGYRYYNLGGISPEHSSTHHPLSGVTRFKQGFGGARYTYPGTFDLVLNKREYMIYQWGRRAIRFLNRA